MNNSFEQNGGQEVPTATTQKALDHITVSLCTYKRSELLDTLLGKMIQQQTEGRFTFSIVVVDNDPKKSAEEVVHQYMSSAPVRISYHHQPVKGLTYARNMSIEHSSGDYIAILDDDEVPVTDWLLQLYKTLKKYNADAVFGSVVPRFEVDPPEWVQRRKFFYWRDLRSETGTTTDKCVTNNVLVRRDLILKHDLKFDHDYAFAGGEDQAFFFELMEYQPDVTFLNCKDAVVHEFITADRCDPDYILKRNILEGRGRVFGMSKFAKSKLQRKIILTARFFQSYFRVLLISAALPFLLMFKKDLGAEYYYRNYYHIGIILALFDFSPYHDRKSIGLQ